MSGVAAMSPARFCGFRYICFGGVFCNRAYRSATGWADRGAVAPVAGWVRHPIPRRFLGGAAASFSKKAADSAALYAATNVSATLCHRETLGGAMRSRLLAAFAGAILFANTAAAFGNTILFGGIGGHNITAGQAASANDGALAIVDQNTAAITIIGHPANVARISGLAFDATGALFATTQPSGGFPPPPGPTGPSDLLRLDPTTGAIISSVPVTANGIPINIADLAVQPGTDSLFGVRGPNDGGRGQGNLYLIDRATGAATLLGNTGHFFDTVAFAPDGTLYLAAADQGGGPVHSVLSVINPANAATIRSVPTADFLGALAVRPDGVIFGGNGDDGELFTIDPLTGAETLVGSTGLNFVGALDFAVPEPATFLLFGSGLMAMAVFRRRRSQDI